MTFWGIGGAMSSEVMWSVQSRQEMGSFFSPTLGQEIIKQDQSLALLTQLPY